MSGPTPLSPSTTSQIANRGIGSTTQLVTRPRSPQQRNAGPVGTLRLRGAAEERRRIRWAEGVVDNEGMGKKKSKVCCIYQKSRPVGESSSEDDSSSSSSSDNDSEPDNSRARIGGKGKKRRHNHQHRHDQNDDGDGHINREEGDRKPAGSAVGKRRASPNAYEKMPRPTVT